jgi:hypothetical protein
MQHQVIDRYDRKAVPQPLPGPALIQARETPVSLPGTAAGDCGGPHDHVKGWLADNPP